MDGVQTGIELAATGIEALAVAIMVGFIAIVTVLWLSDSSRRSEGAYQRYRISVARSLLISLELLVAADIIRTVALDASLVNVAILSGLVGIRTFLGWTLTVEIEGRWPWQKTAVERSTEK